MKQKSLLFVLLFTLLAGLLCGCGKEAQTVYVQPISAIMGYGALGEFTTTAGVVVAQSEVNITRDETRKVAQLNVEAGQEVHAGDVLFSYDMDETELLLDKAELEIEQLKNSVADLTSQIAQLEKEKQYAAESEQLSYTVQIQSLQTDKKETEYNISVKERELEAMRASSQSGDVTAPIDGRVKAINENGTDPNTGEALPYLTLIENGAYRVKGKVNELNRSAVYEGMPVLLRSRTDDTLTWTGTVTTIDTENPDSNSNSGGYYYYGVTEETTSSSTYPFYVELDSTDGLMLGQHVYIEEQNGEAQEGLWLDASYVVATETGNYVWAVDRNGKIEKRDVTIGQRDEASWQFEILDGLTADDCIAFPEEWIREGAKAERLEESGVESGNEPIVDLPYDGGYAEGEETFAVEGGQ